MEILANGRVTLHCGDCLDVIKSLPENSIDSVVCDPPYHLTSIVKRFGNDKSIMSAQTMGNSANTPFKRTAKGFMGKVWDGGDVAFRPETWSAVLRVLKPGGHLLAFSGTRTYHRMACAIEDAGFECRDMIAWMYGSGFPKSHDVSKGIDKRLGAERGRDDYVPNNGNAVYGNGMGGGKTTVRGAPATDLAAQWSGWGSALKPALEPICVARKPLVGTIADNVLKHGTGALNIDGCRVGTESRWNPPVGNLESIGSSRSVPNGNGQFVEGRWPANVLHDGSDEVVAAFPETTSGNGDRRSAKEHGIYGAYKAGDDHRPFDGDSGSAARFFKTCNGRDGEASADRRYGGYGGDIPPGRRREPTDAARFFYTSKADSDDRLGSKHPTVKPIDLMRYLCRLVTPKGGTVLDPFAGTGTTGEAAFREGFNAVLIERETEYQADIRRRMSLVLGGPDERKYASLKAAGKVEDAGPLFGGLL